MARTEKKTRIRKLPPKLQLVEEMSLTGSYPAVARTAIVDNRSGIYKLTYDDQRTTTIFPATSSAPDMSYTSSLPGIPYVPGQDLQPFRDHEQYAVDNMTASNPFWASGSNLEGFTAPLWSKNKIEIDITPATECVITSSYDGIGYEAVFNFDTRLWELSEYGAITGNPITLPNFYQEVGYGFSPSYHSHVSTYELPTRGRPLSNFGFPSLRTTVPGRQFFVSQAINKPFLLEKIYVEISASYEKGGGVRGGLHDIPNLFVSATAYDASNLYGPPPRFASQVSNSYVVNNFFILNHRQVSHKDLNQIYALNNQSNNEYFYFVPTDVKNIYNGSDLVTWFEIASFNNNYSYITSYSLNPGRFERDITIVDTGSVDPFFSSWSSLLKMSGTVRVPNSPDILDPNIPVVFDYQGLTIRRLTTGWFGDRAGLGGIVPNGRDVFRGKKYNSSSMALTYTESPYLLLPTDKLSFRWQLPIPETNISSIFNPVLMSGSPSGYMTFAPVKAKIVLYGSFIEDNQAENNSLNQLLSSEFVHEALE